MPRVPIRGGRERLLATPPSNANFRFAAGRSTKKKSLKAKPKSPPFERNKTALNLRKLEGIVINLDRRTDRFASCEERLRQVCPKLRFSRFRASDGHTDVISADEVVHKWHTGRNIVYQKQRAIRKDWNDLDSYQEKELTLSAGERGCAQSHIRAWKASVEKEAPLLVLEDDAAPTAQFREILQHVLPTIPSDAHVLYLGYSQAAEWRRRVSEYLVESEYVWTTVAYIIWPAGARTLLDMLPVDQPVDNFMAQACAAGKLKSYCMRPKIVFPAEAWNQNSDIKHSDEVDSDIHHSDEFYPGLPGSLANVAPGQAVDSIFYMGDSDLSDASDNEF
jgi:GR25 family glycosyltransferase involved in LPS biosynthesis